MAECGITWAEAFLGVGIVFGMAAFVWALTRKPTGKVVRRPEYVQWRQGKK